MDYSIGYVAKLLGLSVEGIRKYEKSGIITPKRSDSAYRQYEYLDITAMIRAKTYRSLGFSLKETSRLINDLEVPQIVDALKERQEALDHERAITRAKIELMEETIERFGMLKQPLNCPQIRMAPGFYRFEFGVNGVIRTDERTVSTFQKWMKYIPFAHISTRYCDGDAYGGLAIEERFARLFDLHESELVQHIPSGLCVSMNVMETNNAFSEDSCVRALREYAAYHRFEISPEMIGHTITSVTKSTAYKRYREIDAFILPEVP